MIGFTLFASTLAVTLGVLTVLCVVAMRPAELEAVTVSPFAGPVVADPATDTVPHGRCEVTLNGDWHEVELSRLCDVEDYLDSLEACGVRDREVAVAGNDRFLVRWR